MSKEIAYSNNNPERVQRFSFEEVESLQVPERYVTPSKNPELIENIQDFFSKVTDEQREENEVSNTKSPQVSKEGFVSFLKQPEPDDRFVNLYNGNFAAHMDLNIKNANRQVYVAALGEKVILTNISQLRSRSIDANPDGSVTAKRGLFWGQKIDELESDKPYQISPIPEGWRIEICDQMITNELMSKNSKKPLNQRYVDRFNQVIRSALSETIVKDKFTGEKDRIIRKKYFYSLLPIIAASVLNIEADVSGIISNIPLNTFSSLIGYLWINSYDKFVPIDVLRTSKTQLYEYFMPPVEIDRALRGYLFLSLKGRNLVQLSPEFKDKTKIKS